jgi:hypothetical protein
MSEHNGVPHPLGSQRRWAETLLLLLSPFLIVYLLLCAILHDAGISWTFDFLIALIGIVPPCVALFWNGLSSEGEDFHVPWLSDIAANLAYGAAEDEGIHFRKWFRRHFVSWRAIARLEYWPDLDGRISMYLFSQRWPIVFIPDLSVDTQNIMGPPRSGSTTVEFISRKLNETWPGKSTFVISYRPPQTKPGFIAATMRTFSARQKALANALFMLLTLLLYFMYLAIRIGYAEYFWKAIIVLWAVGLIMWVCARLLRKRSTRSTDRHKGLEQHSNGAMSKRID